MARSSDGCAPCVRARLRAPARASAAARAGHEGSSPDLCASEQSFYRMREVPVGIRSRARPDESRMALELLTGGIGQTRVAQRRPHRWHGGTESCQQS